MTQANRFLHVVYFWPRENGSPEDTALLAEGARRNLSSIPGVLRFAVGTPAGTQRDVVDNSYAVALILEFATAADHDIYQDHADHHKFLEECKQYWSRVQVYDTDICAAS